MERKCMPNFALRRAREKEGISRRRLSFELGLYREAVGAYELGRFRAPLKVRNAFAERYGEGESNYRQKPLKIKGIRSDANKLGINDRLREMIYGAGLIPAEVCRIKGYEDSTLTDYLSGKLPISEHVAGWVSSIVGCSIDDLIGPVRKKCLSNDFDFYIRNEKRLRPNNSVCSFNVWMECCRVEESSDVVSEAMRKLSGDDRRLLEDVFGFYEKPRTLVEIGGGIHNRGKIFERKKVALIRLGDIFGRMGFKKLPAHDAD